MASSYIDTINNIYKNQIFIKENVGLGPNAENEEENIAPKRRCLKCDHSAEDCECESDERVRSEDDIVLAHDDSHSDHDDHDETVERASNMVKQNLYRITKMSAMLYDIIPCDSEIEPWIADKISKAVDGINSALSYKDYEEFKNKVDLDIEIEEKTEQDLYSTIDDGGANLINKIKEIMKQQPKAKVEDAVYGMIKMLEA